MMNYFSFENLYFNKNKDFREFIERTSDRAGKKLSGTWFKNLPLNVDAFKKSCGWATENLQDVEKGKTAIIMGASPAIQKQVETLRNIQHDKDFVLCGISSNLEFLLKNGIYPKYIINIDADVSQGDYWKNVDMEKTKNIALISNVFGYPGILKDWQGSLYFLSFLSDDKKMRKAQKKYYGSVNGNGEGFPSLMGQFNVMTAFSFLCLGCSIILFVGHELSFKDLEERYYVDRDDLRDKDKRYPHGDIYGNIVYTTPDLMAIKLSLEFYLELISGAGWFINCTEAGIFGVTKRYPNYRVPWIEQMKLKNGIAQARHIMRTGQPFYS